MPEIVDIFDIAKVTRNEVLANYKAIQRKYGTPVTVKTVPYYSTGMLQFDCVNRDFTDGFGYLVARPNQFVDFFHYQIGERIVYAADPNHRANRADTNLSKANSTNGAFDLVIEEISLHTKPPRVKMNDDGYSRLHSMIAAGDTFDPDVLNALTGIGDIFDPTAICVPQQVSSPFFNANVLWAAVKNQLSVAITFDASHFRELGQASNFTRGNEATTPAADVPPPEDLRFDLLEGLLWARDGEPDSDLTLRATLQKAVTIPISAVDVPAGGGAYTLPDFVWLPITATLWGIEVGIPSSNA